MGMLCAAGMTTMGEILDPYGPWDRDLIQAEIPVAIGTETKLEAMFFRAATGAIGSIFGGGSAGKKYAASLGKVLQEVRDELRAYRGIGPEKRESEDAKTVRKALGGLPPAGKKRKKK